MACPRTSACARERKRNSPRWGPRSGALGQLLGPIQRAGGSLDGREARVPHRSLSGIWVRDIFWQGDVTKRSGRAQRVGGLEPEVLSKQHNRLFVSQHGSLQNTASVLVQAAVPIRRVRHRRGRFITSSRWPGSWPGSSMRCSATAPRTDPHGSDPRGARRPWRRSPVMSARGCGLRTSPHSMGG
jgi:hypothetical protein